MVWVSIFRGSPLEWIMSIWLPISSYLPLNVSTIVSIIFLSSCHSIIMEYLTSSSLTNVFLGVQDIGEYIGASFDWREGDMLFVY